MALLKLQLIGYIGSDATKKESNGRKFLVFNVAISNKYKDKQGMDVESTTWVSCIRNGEQSVDAYLKKGTQVYIEGTPSVNVYTDKDGHQQASLQCNVFTIQLLGGKSTTTQQQQGNSQAAEQDDLPF